LDFAEFFVGHTFNRDFSFVGEPSSGGYVFEKHEYGRPHSLASAVLVMDSINVNELSPGEVALSTDRIAGYRAVLSQGGWIEPIHVYQDAGRWIVRDGNNRVRAYVEHCYAQGLPVGSVPCIIGAGPSHPDSRQELSLAASYYDVGPTAFLAMPVANSANYLDVQGEASERIRQTKLPLSGRGDREQNCPETWVTVTGVV